MNKSAPQQAAPVTLTPVSVHVAITGLVDVYAGALADYERRVQLMAAQNAALQADNAKLREQLAALQAQWAETKK